jgi:tetratricopeptide (TPR) repeat protein
LQGTAFAAVQPASARSTPEKASGESKDELLAQGDREIALRDVAAASDIFNKVLAASPNDPHALYGLAVASVLSGRAEESKQLFQKAVASSETVGPGGAAQRPDPTVLAWSHIYLGRIDDLEGTRDQAIREYQAALAVIGAPESARVAAQNGVDQAYAPPKRPDSQQSSQ